MIDKGRATIEGNAGEYHYAWQGSFGSALMEAGLLFTRFLISGKIPKRSESPFLNRNSE
jgi:hypothetical protein